MQQSEFDFNLLKTFISVIDHGSYTKAAKFLDLPKSKLSRQITKLEQSLKTRLIDRTTRTLEPTPSGRRLYSQAKSHLDELGQTLSELGQHQEKTAGTIRMAAPDDFAIEVMAPICNQFSKHYPLVKFDFVITTEGPDLRQSPMDLAIRIGILKDSSMISRQLGHLRMIFVATTHYLESQPNKPSFENMNQFSFLKFNPSTSKLNLKFTNKNETRTLTCDPTFSSTNLLLIKKMALLSQGIAALPSFLVKAELKDGRLIQVLNEWSGQDIPIQMLTFANEEKQNLIERFVEFTAENIDAYL
jgi:DNA-binding transcriptional LysR family regulator